MSISQTMGTTHPISQPGYVKTPAKLVSYLIHPLFVPLYVAAYLIYLHPYSFAGFDSTQKLLRLIHVFVLTAFFPAVTVFLLWRLQFVESIFLKTQKERIIPYVASIIYFFWVFYVSKNLEGTPDIMVFFFLGIFLAASAALMANNYFKISMHSLGVGGAMVYMIMLALVSGEPMGVAVVTTILITGLVCTCRLLVSDHRPFDVYAGLIVGILSQLVAYYFIM